MTRKMAGLLMAVSCGALLAGGCAKNEVVKKDQSLAPSTTVAKAPTQQEKVKIKEAPVAPVVAPVAKEVVKETAAPMTAETKADQTEELKKELEKVYFNFDSANLSEQARKSLVVNADLLKKIAKGKIRVEGNCDERGSDDYNLALGEKRAKEAVQYLINLGIPAERLTAISYGKEKPVAKGHDEASWAKNRRDDFVVLP